jgi:hypothetical protein
LTAIDEYPTVAAFPTSHCPQGAGASASFSLAFSRAIGELATALYNAACGERARFSMPPALDDYAAVRRVVGAAEAETLALAGMI